MTTDRPLRIGMVGLGRMGANLTARLLLDGHEVVATDLDAEAVERASSAGAVGAMTAIRTAGGMASRARFWFSPIVT